MRVLKSLRVDEETYSRLLRIMGMLQAQEGKRKTIKDAVKFLLDDYERNKRKEIEQSATSG